MEDLFSPHFLTVWEYNRMKLETGINDSYLSTRAIPVMTRKETRRIAMLKRIGLFGGNIPGMKVGRACKYQELEQAYRLVYDCFLEANYIKPNTSRMRIRTFEACPETATFFARNEYGVAGVLSVVKDSPDLGLPSDMCFGKEIDSLRFNAKRLCEGSNLVVAPSFRKSSIATEIMRCGMAETFLVDCDYIVAAYSPAHRSFYELLGFYAISDVKSYSSEINDLVVLMCLDIQKFKQKDSTLDQSQRFIQDFLFFKNPYVQQAELWEFEARQFFFQADLLRKLFVIESDLLSKCTDAERRAIQNRWGAELYAEVAGTELAMPKDLTGQYISEKSVKADKASPTAKPSPLTGQVDS